METSKQPVHFIDKYLLAPTNLVIVTIIGVGATGSQVLTALGQINVSLIALGHPGIFVRLFDDDLMTNANLGKQIFSASLLGLAKSVVLINRINRLFVTNWKAFVKKYILPLRQK